MKPILNILACIIVFCQHLNAADTTIHIYAGKTTYHFAPEAWSFYKSQKPISAPAIALQYQQGKFESIHSKVLNGGIADCYYYIHFSLTNDGFLPAKMVIEIDNSRLNQLELFELNGDSIHSLGMLGDFFPFEQRQFSYKNFQYYIQIGKSARKDYILFVNQIGHTFILPIIVSSAATFDKNVKAEYLTDGVVYGLLLFMSIFSLLFFLNTRYYLYLYYSLYVFTSIFWFFSYFGLGYEFIWYNHPSINTIAAPFFASLNLMLSIKINQVSLNLRTKQFYLYMIGNILQGLLLFACIIPIVVNLNRKSYSVNHIYLLYFLAVIVLSVIVVFLSLIISMIRDAKIVRFYFIASFLKSYSIFLLALVELGVTPVTYYEESLLQVGIIIEIILLTYAIAHRYTSYKARTYQMVVRAQENERDTIAKDIHDSISSTLTAARYTLLRILNKGQINQELRSELDILNNTISHAQIEARNISHNLMPNYIKDYSLNRIIDLYIIDLNHKLEGQSGSFPDLQVRLDTDEADDLFPAEIKLTIFRIIQEIVTNMLKHANASIFNLALRYKKRELDIIAEDNGIGIESSVLKASNGIGLRNIKSRVDLLGGSLIVSTPDKNKSGRWPGTHIHIRIPLRGNSGNEDWQY